MLVSLYYFRRSQKNISDTCDLESYVKNLEGNQRLTPCFHAAHINGKLVADFLIRYEQLDEDIKKLETQLNCPGLLDTFHSIKAKGEIRPRERTVTCEIYCKNPNAKSAVDKLLLEQQNDFEFLRKYWHAYKAKLEADMAKYHQSIAS